MAAHQLTALISFKFSGQVAARFAPGRSALFIRRHGVERAFKVTLRVSIPGYLEGEMLNSGRLENSREAEEESKLCSIHIYDTPEISLSQLRRSKPDWLTLMPVLENYRVKPSG